MTATQRTIRVGTRSSDLAKKQAELAVDAIESAHPQVTCELVLLSTRGDEDQSTPLWSMNGTGAFTKRLEEALLAREVDIAVHSAKDLPAQLAPRLEIGAVLPRGPVEDALVSRRCESLEDLALGAVIGTSSPRRAAQLLRIRQDLEIKPIRGNVPTRLRKVNEGEYDATIIALAGLERLGLSDSASQILPSDTFLPAPGQGIIALECRDDDDDLLDLLLRVRDRRTKAQSDAERGFLAALRVGCQAAVAGHATWSETGLQMTGRVLSVDGRTLLEAHMSGAPGRLPSELGKTVAERLIQQGARKLIDSSETDLENHVVEEKAP